VKRIILFIPFVVFLGLGFFLLKGLSLDPKELPSALIDKPFPPFQGQTLKGATVTEADLRGSVSLVNIWATWCPTCKQEHAYLNKLAAQGVKIYGVNYKDQTAKAIKWLKDLGDPYEFNVQDEDGMIGLELGVYGAPETYVVDAQGIVRLKHVGDVNDRVWKNKIEPVYQQYLGQLPEGKQVKSSDKANASQGGS
jgi:cytochrome c biogenesis protein CcmG/thiol:disulfide interchange protein DsbE